MCKNALGLDRIHFCSNSGIHEPAWLQGAQPGSPGQVQGDHIHHAFFYVPWNFFPFHGKYFLSSAMENLVSSTIENIFIRHGQIFNFKQTCNLESGSQGECGATGSPILCSPTTVKDTFLDMRVSLDDGDGDDDGVREF